MSEIINLKINGKDCMAQAGDYLVEAARKNGIYIPTLCNMEGVKPRGSCRICTVLVNGKKMTACTTTVAEGMNVETENEELKDLRKAIIEILFVEGNHFCPACERSGRCELQALAYRFQVLVPRFPFQFPVRGIEANHPKLVKDHNRCILCKRCIRAIKDDKGRSLFAFRRRGYNVEITIDTKLGKDMDDATALRAMEVCPVGAILRKEKGFDVPIGKRQYDTQAIGSEVESAAP